MMGSYKDSSELFRNKGPRMPLETATYIHDLVASNPAATDGLSQGDDHLRLIKSVLQANFPNFNSAALNSSNSALDAAVNVLTGASGATAFPAGTVGAPSIAFTGDPDSGWFKPAEDQWELALGGAATLTATTAGITVAAALGVGTNFNANGTITAAGAYLGGTGQLCPVGSVVMWLTNTAPTGWAFLNGSVVTAASNPGLAAIFGSVGGNVTLPDWRGWVPIGVGTMGGTTHSGPVNLSGIDTLNSGVGAATHTLTTAECPTGLITFNDAQHSHTIPWSFSSPNVWSNGANGAANDASPGSTSTSSVFTGCSITDHGGNGAHTIVQPSATCAFIIKLG